MCSGVVPQQPPTKLTQRSPTKRASLSARLCGVSPYWPRSSGSPAFGYTLVQHVARPASERRWSVMNSGPVAQLRPIEQSRRCGSEMYSAATAPVPGGRAREASGGHAQLVRAVGEPVLAEHIGRAAEGVRGDDVRARIDIGRVDPANDVGPREVQVLVAPFVALAAEVA